MSGAEHSKSAIEKFRTETQRVEEGTPQHYEPVSRPGGTLSQDTPASSNSNGPTRHDTISSIGGSERWLPIQQPETSLPEITQHRDGPLQMYHRSFSQDTLVPLGNYKPTRPIVPVLRKPVPMLEERDHQYLPVQQNDIPHNIGESTHQAVGDTQQRKKQKIITPFAVYGLSLLLVFFAGLGFWIQSRSRAIYFSKEKTRWMFDNPKTNTMLWTSAAALLAWFTLWLHACTVSLMARKLIIQGAKISTIECWVKLSNNGTMLDRRRPFLSLYTAIAAITTAALTVGFAGLLTPISLIRFNKLVAAEIDMTRSDFKEWYADPSKRPFTGLGCQWYTHINTETGKSYTFPTCPFQDDNSLVLQAGRAAVEAGFGLTTITKIGDVNFNGTTGGTLPIGRNGFQAFDTMKYHIDEDQFPLVYNYSSLLQGSTIEVSCEETDTSPISSENLEVLETTSPKKINYHVRYNFTQERTGGRCEWSYNQDFIVPEGGNLMTFMCGAKNETPSDIPAPNRLPVSPFYIFFRPFGDYETGKRGLQLQNVTCKLEPRVTLNNVTYNSATNDFTSRVVKVLDDPAPTDFESIDAIYQVFWYGISKQGNIVADTIVSLRHQNGGDNKQSMAKTYENILKGFYEIEMTSLRLYYSSNFPPGRREITGTLTHFRMGYNGSIEALYALGPLAIVVIMGVSYLVWGLWVGGEMFEFNPTRASSLLVASSQGGLSRLNPGVAPHAGKYPDEGSLQDVKVKFGELPHGVFGLGLHEETIHQPPRYSSDFYGRRSNV